MRTSYVWHVIYKMHSDVQEHAEVECIGTSKGTVYENMQSC